jgi:hypothetical protein
MSIENIFSDNAKETSFWGRFFKKRSFICSILALAIALMSFGTAMAHPGNTASDGCHYCRTNCSSWGVPWNTRHCHGGYVAAPPIQTPEPWSCEIEGTKFYSNSEASEYWYLQIDKEVKRVYKDYLERETNDFDLEYWHSRFPYNSCNGSWNPAVIKGDVIDSDELKEIQRKLAEKNKPQEQQGAKNLGELASQLNWTPTPESQTNSNIPWYKKAWYYIVWFLVG